MQRCALPGEPGNGRNVIWGLGFSALVMLVAARARRDDSKAKGLEDTSASVLEGHHTAPPRQFSRSRVAALVTTVRATMCKQGNPHCPRVTYAA